MQFLQAHAGEIDKVVHPSQTIGGSRMLHFGEFEDGCAGFDGRKTLCCVLGDEGEDEVDVVGAIKQIETIGTDLAAV